jgi:metal-responsive CopG/Arc/MetJ family transcriptional regulator
MPKKVLVSIADEMLEEVDFVAMFEHRNRSDLVREALRRYVTEFKKAHGGNNSITIQQPKKQVAAA